MGGSDAISTRLGREFFERLRTNHGAKPKIASAGYGDTAGCGARQGSRASCSSHCSTVLRRPFTLRSTAMADNVTKSIRSKIMSSVSSSDTGPELALRRTLHALGFRYRTNYRKLPGKPDIAFPKLKKVVFVHGCFWHGHFCKKGRLPKSHIEYWQPKIAANRARDVRTLRAVRRLGWKTLVVWECEIKDLERNLPRILRFLRDERG